MLKFLQLALIRFGFNRYKLILISFLYTKTRLAKKSVFLARTSISIPEDAEDVYAYRNHSTTKRKMLCEEM